MSDRSLLDEDAGSNETAPADTPEQATLFGDLDEFAWWQKYWTPDLPEFVMGDLTPDSTITVQFLTTEDRVAFLKLVGEAPTRIKSIWYPRQEYLRQSDVDAPSCVVPPNRYPVYVITKGRHETRLTERALTKLGIAHYVVIEPQEVEQYVAAGTARERILTLPFSNLGSGSIPARNFVWDHAVEAGARRHWILDDNLDGFYRLNRNLKRRIVDENPFLAAERLADRYRNVALAGLQYEFFATRRTRQPPFRLNTRVYSCILINHDLPFRWRGRYNEDTDLSLRALKAGWCTILLNAYLCKKMPTMTMAGGNTDELYQDDGRLEMAESLRRQHPDVTVVTEKWGRWQHHVDYTPFARNTLIPIEEEAVS